VPHENAVVSISSVNHPQYQIDPEALFPMLNEVIILPWTNDFGSSIEAMRIADPTGQSD
jgi:hypothetical protein